jgi:hypothetical protein
MNCSFRPALDGKLRCLPTSAHAGNTFADSGCSIPLAYAYYPDGDPSCGRPQGYAATITEPPHVYLVGDPWFQPAYSGSPGSCIPSNQIATFYAQGAEAPPELFVAATEQLTPHGRLAYVELVGDDGSRQLEGTLADQSTGDRCFFVEVEPGRAACVPTDVGFTQSGFMDAACTIPGALYSGATTPTRALVRNPRMCTNQTSLAQLGPSAPGYVLANGSCVASGGIAAPILAQGPLTDFVSATLEIAPGATRLRSLAWVTADGLRSPAGNWDTASSWRCDPTVEAGTSLLACAPRWADNGISLYSDSSCSTYLMAVQPACRDESAAIWFGTLTTPMRTCDGPRYSIFAYAEPIALGVVWEHAGDGSCVSEDLTGVPVRTNTAGYLDGTTLVPMRYEVE